MGIDWPINSSITISLGSLLSKFLIKKLIEIKEIKKIMINIYRKIFGGNNK